ncbi:hypothetical protein SAMN05216464_109279 [Mucilaginibacter pineti]|uniref:COMM domain-containing protein n=1 Tax=Mucilaginibacter pineti TaxID=1391627 RepID=A0A1G7FYH7_9SPHI|nr:hypothetical protein [Mucilaginibacter pineti]SDE80973.1 hypothetical protein SAMN05216464_109279 [Mucilaginibacter pineti]
MKNLSIPKDDLDVLILFENLSVNDKDCVIQVFNNFAKGQTYDITADKIAQVTSLSYDNAFVIIGVYFVLLRTINLNNYNQEDFIKNVVTNSAIRYEIEDEDKSKVDNAIKTLLTINNPNLLLTSIASYLTSQNSNLLTGFSVFSDLKPIKTNNQISGLALNNVLKLRFRGENQEENQMFFSFDADDLNELINKLTELKESNELLKAKYNDDIIYI